MAKSLIRWDPASDLITLRDAMDRLWSEGLGRPWSSLGAFFGGGSLALDMYETATDVMVEAVLPGLKPEQVDVQVVGNVLTIKGERQEEKRHEGASYIHQERSFGSFCRSLTLPTEVDVEKARAEFENGILILTLPKSEAVKAKTIKIKTK